MKLTWCFLKRFKLRKTLRFFTYYKERNHKIKNLKNIQPIVHLDGYQLSTIPDDIGISRELQIFKTHEPLTTKLTSKILEKGMTCLDIGANIGYYAFLESKAIGENGKVIAIEPSPINFKQLKKNLELNNFSNVEVYNFACGDKEGKVELVLSPHSNLSYVAASRTKIPEDAQIIEVQMIKMDDFVEEKKLSKVDFIRMDVEGYEINIFDGMWGTIKKFKKLKKNLELNNFSNVEVYNFAGGDKKGKVEFVLSPLSNLSYVATSRTKIPEGAQITEVQMIKMDDFVEEKKLSKVDFVRMDVEGYEINIFEGMWDTIKKFKPIIQMEFHVQSIGQKEQLKFFTTLRDLGYEIKHYIPRALDFAIIGEESDVKNYSIDEFIEMIKKKMFIYAYIVFLKHSK